MLEVRMEKKIAVDRAVRSADEKKKIENGIGSLTD
jgi:hypothetical protein